MTRLRFTLDLPAPRAEVFAWHERPGAFERLSPPWRAVRVVERSGGIRDGARVTLDLGAPIGRWRLEHHDYRSLEAFHDRQVSGPFASYAHAHRFRDSEAGSVLEDELDFRLPLAPFSAPAEPFLRADFERLFAWRHRVTKLDLERRMATGGRALRIGVTGASGFLGRELSAFLTTQGHEVVRFVRGRAARAGEVAWDPGAGALDPAALVGLDAVVHLAGAGIADAPWTAERKRELVESRVQSTATLARAMAAAAASGGPRVLVSTSAIGIYGHRADERLTEQSSPGEGFLAALARDWEAAAEPAREAGLRVVHPRIGVVLWPRAGALPVLALPYRLGAGGPFADGRGWFSWVSLHDLLDMLLWSVVDERARGAFNAVAPQPVRHRDLARALGHVLSRPALLPVPAFALRLALGREKADEMLLASQHVLPWMLEAAGFVWRDPSLGPALAWMYGLPRLESRA